MSLREQSLEMIEGLDPDVFAAFQRAGRGLVGLIVAFWGRDNDGDHPDYYWHEGGWVAAFDDALMPSAELPKIYKTKRWIQRTLRKQGREAKRLGDPRRIGVALWRHPDAHAVPLEKYLKMSGPMFPGCPRA